MNEEKVISAILINLFFLAAIASLTSGFVALFFFPVAKGL